jgi:large subunit ribosomal protein L10
MSRQIIVQKTHEVEEIKKLIQQHKAFGIASLQKVRAAQLQELKKKLKGIAYVQVIKNTLMKRALAELKEKPNIDKLEGFLSGSNIFLLTELNPFKLALLLEKGRVKTTAKAGDIAALDVIVPGGNTGLPPGPIISQLGSVGLPTRIEAGSVWVNRNTLVAKKGDVIDVRLASVLSKLGIKPVEVGLILKAIYENGLVFTEDQLRLDLEGFRKGILEAQLNAFNLSINVAYPISENVSLLIQTAHQKALNLALNASIPTSETIGDLLRKAYLQGLTLNVKLSRVEEKTQPSQASAGPSLSGSERLKRENSEHEER